MAKSSGGQRESEGVVVVQIGVQNNAPGAKDPCFDRVCARRQGMVGTFRPNSPAGVSPSPRPAKWRFRPLVGTCENFSASYAGRQAVAG